MEVTHSALTCIGHLSFLVVLFLILYLCKVTVKKILIILSMNQNTLDRYCKIAVITNLKFVSTNQNYFLVNKIT